VNARFTVDIDFTIKELLFWDFAQSRPLTGRGMNSHRPDQPFWATLLRF